MSQFTIQGNVAFSPETLAAMEELAYSLMRALRPVVAAAGGGSKGLPANAAEISPTELGGGADGMLAELDDDRDETPAPNAEVIPPAEKWSEERVSAMATLRAMGESWEAIWSKLNLLPGPRIASLAAAQTRYSELKRSGKLPVVRAAEPAGTRKVDISVSRLLEEHAAKNADVAATDWGTICDWAKFNKVDIEGMVQAAALQKINRARRHFELPLFVVTRAFGPTEALPPFELGGVDPKAYAKAEKYKRRAA